MKKVKLGEICEIVTGSTPKSSNPNYWNGEYKWITPAEISDDDFIVFDTQRKITKLGIEETGLKSFPTGTVLLSSRAPIGKVAISGCEMYCNQGFKNFICSNKINNEYLYYFFKARKNYLNILGRGATFKEISKSIVSDIEIFLPTYDIQRKQVKVLKKIDKLIYTRKEQLIEFEYLVKSRFNEMFGDFYTTLFPKYKIGEKFEVSSGSTPSRDNKLYWDSGTINWVKTTEVINREITETEEKITKFALENTSLKLFPVDTILIAMYGQGQTRGRSAILKVESTSNQACGAIFPNKIDNPVFIWHQLMLRYSELRELGRGGNQPNLNGQLIKNFELIFPPLALQNEFADFVAQVDKSQLAIQKSLEELETLKKSLMQEYFS
ncbi:type I restriction-modification system S subunit [Streptococcus pseudopneumoniae]|uniref:restriction endonuclease subunit S n=4 Tax=Streptococcus TaxID=1301 RepID=UPI0005E2279B|nr:restriction endonuclease subunit S [Streptococcus pseudopneumoniae]CJZ10716.1 type I restriction-modification system S subunit [Streptococcus pseudopneumoniae]